MNEKNIDIIIINISYNKEMNRYLRRKLEDKIWIIDLNFISIYPTRKQSMNFQFLL